MNPPDPSEPSNSVPALDGIRQKWASSSLYLILSLAIAITYFFIATHSFSESPRKTFDEVLYHRMGIQLQIDMNAYHALPMAVSRTPGERIPDYVRQPLYKHPPLFSYFILIAQLLFGSTLMASSLVPAFFGAATVMVVFALGKACYNALTGFAAALLLALNPIHAICGQKLWLATTMTFFMTLAVLLTVLAIQRNQHYLLLLASASIGLAALTKYPGILALPLLAIPVWRTRPRKAVLIAFFAIPFVFLLPWLQWNMEVYGINVVYDNFLIHFASGYRQNPFIVWVTLVVGFAGFVFLIWMLNKRQRILSFLKVTVNPPIPHARVLFSFALAGLLFIPTLKGLNWNYFPDTSWEPGYFHHAPLYFYIERMLIYSPLFLSAFLLTIWIRDQPVFVKAITFYAAALLGFYIAWDNFQCRYIQCVIPIMAILAARGLLVAFKSKRVFAIGGVQVRVSAILAILVVYAVVRAMQFNLNFSYPNTMCYF